MSARGIVRVAAASCLAAIVSACLAQPSPTLSPPLSPSPTSTAAPSTAPPEATASPRPSETAVPTATPEPPLSLEQPDERDDRAIRVDVVSDVPVDGDGTITVTVESLADSMIRDLVLRWPEGLHATLFPAPFQPSADRIRDGGPPLRQEWTKWVIGPGERGEPAGTVSLGYGPLPAGGTLEIPLYVTRRADGAVAFDLQVLAEEALLELDDGEPAQLRIEVP